MRILMTTIGLGAMLMSVPAAAIDSPARSADANAASGSSTKSTASQAVKEKKYCIQYDEVTGSRVSAAECKTKAQWAKEGINVDEPAKQDQ